MKKIILTLLLTLSALVNVNAATAFSLDVDNNGSLSSSNDGLVIFKYLLNPDANNLHTTIANDAAEDRKTTAQLKAYLDNAGGILDVDGNKSLSSSNDGLVIFKYLLNPNSNNLHTTIANDAVSSKTTTIDLKAYLDQYIGSVVITTGTGTVTGTFKESDLAVGAEYTNNDNDDLDSGTYVETFIAELEDGVEVDISKRVSTGISYTVSSDVNTGTATATGTFSESDVGNEYTNNDNDDLDNGTYIETFTTEFINGVEDISKRTLTGTIYTVTSDVNTGTATATGTFSESDPAIGDKNKDTDTLDSGTYVNTFTTEFINGVEDTSKRTLTITTYNVTHDINTGTATVTGTFSESDPAIGNQNNDGDDLDSGTYVKIFATEFINGVEDTSKRTLTITTYNVTHDVNTGTATATGTFSESDLEAGDEYTNNDNDDLDSGTYVRTFTTEFINGVEDTSKRILIETIYTITNDVTPVESELTAIYAADTPPTAFISGGAIDTAALAIPTGAGNAQSRVDFLSLLDSGSTATIQQVHSGDTNNPSYIVFQQNQGTVNALVNGTYSDIATTDFRDWALEVVKAIWHLEHPNYVRAKQLSDLIGQHGITAGQVNYSGGMQIWSYTQNGTDYNFSFGTASSLIEITDWDTKFQQLLYTVNPTSHAARKAVLESYNSIDGISNLEVKTTGTVTITYLTWDLNGTLQPNYYFSATNPTINAQGDTDGDLSALSTQQFEQYRERLYNKLIDHFPTPAEIRAIRIAEIAVLDDAATDVTITNSFSNTVGDTFQINVVGDPVYQSEFSTNTYENGILLFENLGGTQWDNMKQAISDEIGNIDDDITERNIRIAVLIQNANNDVTVSALYNAVRGDLFELDNGTTKAQIYVNDYDLPLVSGGYTRLENLESTSEYSALDTAIAAKATELQNEIFEVAFQAFYDLDTLPATLPSVIDAAAQAVSTIGSSGLPRKDFMKLLGKFGVTINNVIDVSSNDKSYVELSSNVNVYALVNGFTYQLDPSDFSDWVFEVMKEVWDHGHTTNEQRGGIINGAFDTDTLDVKITTFNEPPNYDWWVYFNDIAILSGGISADPMYNNEYTANIHVENMTEDVYQRLLVFIEYMIDNQARLKLITGYENRKQEIQDLTTEFGASVIVSISSINENHFTFSKNNESSLAVQSNWTHVAGTTLEQLSADNWVKFYAKCRGILIGLGN